MHASGATAVGAAPNGLGTITRLILTLAGFTCAGWMTSAGPVVEWTRLQPFPATAQARTLMHDGRAVVALCDGGVILHHAPAGSWQRAATPTTNELRSGLFAMDRFIVAGDGGTIATSDDGLGWEKRNTSTGANLVAVAAAGSNLFALGEGGALPRSTDGLASVAPANADFLHTAPLPYGGRTYVAVGDAGTVFSSIDGVAVDPLRTRSGRRHPGDVVFGNGVRWPAQPHKGGFDGRRPGRPNSPKAPMLTMDLPQFGDSCAAGLRTRALACQAMPGIRTRCRSQPYTLPLLFASPMPNGDATGGGIRPVRWAGRDGVSEMTCSSPSTHGDLPQRERPRLGLAERPAFAHVRFESGRFLLELALGQSGDPKPNLHPAGRRDLGRTATRSSADQRDLHEVRWNERLVVGPRRRPCSTDEAGRGAGDSGVSTRPLTCTESPPQRLRHVLLTGGDAADLDGRIIGLAVATAPAGQQGLLCSSTSLSSRGRACGLARWLELDRAESERRRIPDPAIDGARGGDCGRGRHLLRLTDGAVWDSLAPVTAQNLSAIAWGNDRWLVQGQAPSGPILRSNDGLSWSATLPEPYSGSFWPPLRFEGGTFCALFQDSAMPFHHEGRSMGSTGDGNSGLTWARDRPCGFRRPTCHDRHGLVASVSACRPGTIGSALPSR